MGRKKDVFKIAVCDLETDPFKYGRVPLPFAAAFYDGEIYIDFWGDNCVAQLMEWLSQQKTKYRIYAHNGGKFDFWYFQPWITNPLFFIKTRLVKAGLMEHHELRDSFSIIPVKLADYQKDSIDYANFEINKRERHKRAILRYLQSDCIYLFELVTRFIEQFGDKLTIASTAMSELKKLHEQKSCAPSHDAAFRPYYFGGRVECFETGECRGDFKFYDVNSMYPFVMRTMNHPLGDDYCYMRHLPDSGFYFADITAYSNGALPIRAKDGLKFPRGEFRFFACSHEITTALQFNLIKIKKVHHCFKARQLQRFDSFIDKYAQMKINAELAGDKAMRLFAKLLMNSAYGKFAQDPTQFKDTFIYETLDSLKEDGAQYIGNFDVRFLGEKPALIRAYSFLDVAIAASITSAARSLLLQGICRADRVIYCDTDSVVAEGLDLPLHDTELGAWKTEARADKVYIAGKKLYSAFLNGKPVKKASKGVNLSYEEVQRIALGETVESPIDAPSLRLGQDAKFIARTIARTH